MREKPISAQQSETEQAHAASVSLRGLLWPASPLARALLFLIVAMPFMALGVLYLLLSQKRQQAVPTKNTTMVVHDLNALHPYPPETIRLNGGSVAFRITGGTMTSWVIVDPASGAPIAIYRATLPAGSIDLDATPPGRVD